MALTPLDTLAELLARYGADADARALASLAARDDVRRADFFEDLIDPRLWDRRDSIASRGLDGASAADAREFRRALFLIADDLALRGLGSGDSDWWAEQLRE